MIAVLILLVAAFGVILGGIFLIVGILEDDLTDWGPAAGVTWFVAFIVFLVGAVPTAAVAGGQIQTNRYIDKTFKVEKVYDRKANELIPQFKSFLAEQYPQYEQQVFTQISSPQDVSLFFVRYPELKASEGLRDLVGKIDQLKSDIFKQQIKRQDYIAEARSTKANPWFLSSFLEEPRTDRAPAHG